MDLIILDENLEPFAILDSYNSLIWTDRYNECGDFEIYTAMSEAMLTYVKQDYYIRRPDSEHVMIIEKIEIDTDVEEGNNITITGRSLESLLDRRIVWNETSLSGNLQDGIEKLLNENIISPSNERRKIPNFKMEKSEDPLITNLTIEAQYKGDNLYDILTAICAERSIGFKVILSDENELVFSLYVGADRSYDQTENPYVIFSPNFDNLISSNYIESKSSLKNVTLVSAEDSDNRPEEEGAEAPLVETAVGNVSGLARRETFTDYGSISRTVTEDDQEKTLSDSEITAMLRQKGKETLAEYASVLSFEGEAETSTMFKYGEDFTIGDIVQVEDHYGHESRARVIELVLSDATDGFSVYPTFSAIAETGLPEGYLQLSCIGGTGTQYIDTGFKPNENTRVVMDVTSTADGTFALFGTRDSETSNAYILWQVNTTSVRSDYGANQVQQTVDDTRYRVTVDKNEATCMYGSIPIENEASQFACANNLLLFTTSTGGVVDERKASARLYSCKVYDDGLLIRDFVPVKNDSDQVGLYDLVEEKFYANAGTGAFLGAS